MLVDRWKILSHFIDGNVPKVWIYIYRLDGPWLRCGNSAVNGVVAPVLVIRNETVISFSAAFFSFVFFLLPKLFTRLNDKGQNPGSYYECLILPFETEILSVSILRVGICQRNLYQHCQCLLHLQEREH